jgi:hypothetical protein
MEILLTPLYKSEIYNIKNALAPASPQIININFQNIILKYCIGTAMVNERSWVRNQLGKKNKRFGTYILSV